MPLMNDGYKRVSLDGLPKEDGSYLILFLLEEELGPHLCVRFTNSDGSITWAGTEYQAVHEADISLYIRK